MANRAGQQFGNYRLVKLLGSGGFAEVWLGEHVYLSGRQVAIKILHASLPPEFEKLFLKEAQTVANFHHPHIVQLIDFGIQEGSPYLIMQYAPNGSLRDHYPRGSVVPLNTIVQWVIQIADALQYAHDKGFIHLDVKPENILLSEDNQLVLTDFGIATIVQKTEYMIAGGFAGTASYSAPEQYQGKPRKESDQYALDTIVYEWLCGRVPFQGSFAELAISHLQDRPRPLRERVADIPVAVEAVVMRALAKEPKYRFHSVREYALALQQAVSTNVKPPEAETPYPIQPAATDNEAPAEALIAKAQELYDEERYEEALTASERAIRLDPQNAMAHAHRGVTLFVLGRYEEALAANDQAIHLDPRDAGVYHLKGLTLFAFGRHKEALAAFDQAISLDPKNADAYYKKGLVLNKLGRHEEEIAAYDQAISLDPQNARLYIDKGHTLFTLNRHQEALVAIDQAISLDPQNVWAYCFRGEMLGILGRDTEALTTFDQAIRLDPQFAIAYHDRGAMLSKLHRYEEALVAYDQAIRLDPQNASTYALKGATLYALGRHKEALVAFDQAISLDPKDADSYNMRGTMLNELGRYEEALVAFDQAISLDPKDADSYCERGIALHKLHRYEEALVAFDQAIHLDPRDASTYHEMGRVLNKLGRREEAKRAFALEKEYRKKH